MAELHEKYAPILHFTKNEQFFPMRADAMLDYSGLYLKDQDQPLVKPGRLTANDLNKFKQTAEVFVRSVAVGPLFGQEVIKEWGEGATEMILRWAEQTTDSWSDSLAERAYRWFSPKTVAATRLFWWNNVIASAVNGALQSNVEDELPRLILPRETRDSAIERYHDTFKKGTPEYTYYYRYIRDGDYLCVQYWFFYSYNDWGRGYAGLNDHEGDWESMVLFFKLDAQKRPQEPPAYVTYANHESRMTKAWDDPDVQRVGNHPQGFVGAGSHAAYPNATTYDLAALYNLFDYATGDGDTINHDQWVHRIALNGVSWLGNFGGSWGTRFWVTTTQAKTILRAALAFTPLSALAALNVGPQEIELPGVSAPRGPTHASRKQNSNPVAWAGISE